MLFCSKSVSPSKQTQKLEKKSRKLNLTTKGAAEIRAYENSVRRAVHPSQDSVLWVRLVPVKS